MADYKFPGVYTQEGPIVQDPIHGVGTSTFGMLGLAEKGPTEVQLINSFQEYRRIYGGYLANSYLTYAVDGFFSNGGCRCFIGRIEVAVNNKPTAKDFIGGRSPLGVPSGLEAFRDIDEINIVYVPDIHILPETEATILIASITDHCEKAKYRFTILDIAKNQENTSLIEKPVDSGHAAVYYPWLKINDPVSNMPVTIPPGGHVAGVYVRTDTNRGVHKAPANEVIRGILGTEYTVTKHQQDILNPKGINVIRHFPGRGIRVWGARTCSTDPDWKYVNVRRLFFYIQGSIEKGIKWAVFEPNDYRLWEHLKLNITDFMYALWRDGVLVGITPEQAFFVKCDRSTMTQEDIDNGWLVCLIGVAPIKPAEFIIFRIRQKTV